MQSAYIGAGDVPWEREIRFTFSRLGNASYVIGSPGLYIPSSETQQIPKISVELFLDKI